MDLRHTECALLSRLHRRTQFPFDENLTHRRCKILIFDSACVKCDFTNSANFYNIGKRSPDRLSMGLQAARSPSRVSLRARPVDRIVTRKSIATREVRVKVGLDYSPN